MLRASAAVAARLSAAVHPRPPIIVALWIDLTMPDDLAALLEAAAARPPRPNQPPVRCPWTGDRRPPSTCRSSGKTSGQPSPESLRASAKNPRGPPVTWLEKVSDEDYRAG